jgi:ABC-type nitrate/sulfonate/bicarbonate transport system permease component
VLGVLGYVLNWAFGLVERRVLRWYLVSQGSPVR